MRRLGIRRTASVVSAGTLAVAVLASCSASPAKPAFDWSAWNDRMQTALYDSSGGGSLAGLTPGGGDLESVQQGDYDLVAACIGDAVVHVTARAGGRLLGESDVPCGATVQIPISYRSASGLELRATSQDRASDGAWFISLNRPSWKQTGALSSG